MPLNIIKGDLACFQADAVVNAANSKLLAGGGVCGALFQKAGPEQLAQACAALAPVAPGQAALTPGFKHPASYIIHAVGPVYRDGRSGEAEILASAYTSALQLAQDHELRSIAFPLISAGIYGYPKAEALDIAIRSIRSFLDSQQTELDVSLVLFDKEGLVPDTRLRRELDRLMQLGLEDASLSARIADKMEVFEASRLDAPRPLSPKNRRIYEKKRFTEADCQPCMGAAPAEKGLDDLIQSLDEGFSATLLRLIDAKGVKDSQVYKKANIDRKHFSKIRSNPSYTPSRATVLALAIGLELSRRQTEDLLARAGYALSGAQAFDVIVGFFIDQGIYQIDTINTALFAYDQALLGAGL